jgi:type IV secretion system protein VirB6
MAAFNVTSQIFTYVDTVVSQFVATNLSNVIGFAAPLVGLGLTMALMLEGLFLMGRPNGEPLSSLVNRFVRYAIIISIASAGGWYQTKLAETAMHLPDDFASALVINGESGASTQTSIANSIDQALDNGLTVGKTAFEHAGVLSGPHLASLVLAITVLLVTALMCGIGAGMILMAKLMLGITVCFGPIFIFLLLFESMKALFTKWIGSIINYGLISVLFSAVFGLMLSFFKAAIGAAAAYNPTSPIMAAILTCTLVLLISWFVLKEIPHLASSWGQGVAADIFRHVRQSKDGMEGSAAAIHGGNSASSGQSGRSGSGSSSSAATSSTATQASQSATNGLARGSRRSA